MQAPSLLRVTHLGQNSEKNRSDVFADLFTSIMSKYENAKTIAVLPDTHRQLHECQIYEDSSYDDTVKRLIEFYRENSEDF